jgi:multidrug efflux pump subunit AcrA (membrane-fusion protein)
MKEFLIYLLTASLAVAAEDSGRFQNMVRLKEAEAALLKLETAEAEEMAFEETVFALGGIEVLPGKRAVVSSRIAGRAFSVLVTPDQEIGEGDEVAWIESRQPGDPPPTVMLPAPMAGTVATVKIAPGQPVGPDDVLVEIVNLEVVEAAAQVPQHLAGALRAGQSARIRVAAYPDKVFEATLAHLATEADAGDGTLEAAFHVANPDKLLRPGMRAEFTIVTGKREGVMAVPRAAVLGDGGRRFVMVKDYELEHAFLRTGIETGAMNDGFVEVVSGLFPGDEVVTRGVWNLASATSSVSLREAMDAAHGHPHNEDGSEMTKEQIAAAENEQEGREGGGGSMWSPLAVFFAGTSGVLLVLLALVSLRRKGGSQ